MPHKKAKRSVREQERKSKGKDEVPSKTGIETEAIPKSISRVLNAATLRESFHKRKREAGESGKTLEEMQRDGDMAQKKRKKTDSESEKMTIKPGESLSHFNRRVEGNMRGQVRAAMQAGNAHTRKSKQDKSKPDAKVDKKEPDTPPPSSPLPPKKTEFDQVPSRKRLNDIAQAPPNLKKPPKRVSKESAGAFGKKDVVPPEQRRMMEVEREKAIRRYREMKERNAAKQEAASVK